MPPPQQCDDEPSTTRAGNIKMLEKKISEWLDGRTAVAQEFFDSQGGTEDDKMPFTWIWQFMTSSMHAKTPVKKSYYNAYVSKVAEELKENTGVLITGRKVKMNYRHYDYAIRYLLGVELVGLLDGDEKPVNPAQIKTMSRLRETAKALKTFKMAWQPISAHRLRKLEAELPPDAQRLRGKRTKRSKAKKWVEPAFSEDEEETDVEDDEAAEPQKESGKAPTKPRKGKAKEKGGKKDRAKEKQGEKAEAAKQAAKAQASKAKVAKHRAGKEKEGVKEKVGQAKCTSGAGAASLYNGTDLVVESNNNLVVVVIQYRLGLFGFLAGQQVHDYGVANAALWDQQFALRWVHDNIQKFGGDPDLVTIWGESAGAGSIFQHIVANGGKTEPQLFRAAITSSAFAAIQYSYNHPIPQGHFDTISALANCTNATNLDCLRAVDADTLSSINVEVGLASFYGIPYLLPVVDGTFVVESPLIQLANGDVNGEYYLGITNTNEGTIFIDADGNYTVAGWLRNVMPAFSVAQSDEIASVYSTLGGSVFDQIEVLFTEAGFLCPTQDLLTHFPNKSYKGQFAIPPAWHGNDLPYYFPDLVSLIPTIPAPWNNTAFTDAFIGGFFAFAANYDPNKKLAATILPEWPLWSADAKEFMLFNQTDTATPAPAIGVQKLEDAVLQRCELWRTWRLETSQ
ncbi:COesterase domain-containing protein [Mycena chlorophos]|uniref:Carboxylic ester hydrolase n=1 Tax=Mycena chlorophos TaxID=658473 RepID=A0A8H6S6V3_MYCCL|nr:COesterase domain-containing protein [Mycena chlorophos]